MIQDVEVYGGGKRISVNIVMLERNIMDFDRGSVCLRYVVVIMEDVDYFLGKILYKDMKGIRFVYRKRYYI